MKVVLMCAATFCCSAFASEPVSGRFVASKACDSYSSFAKGTNPGSVRTKPGGDYAASEVNKPGDYQWIRIDVPEATPPLRWVSRECGVATLSAAGTAGGSMTSGSSGGGGQCKTANKHDSYVLAMSWQAGFCEHATHGRKPECDALGDGSLSINNLTLHGLWPNRKECGTNYGTCGGKPFALSEDTVARIAPWMPNFYYDTSLGEHEWEKHGSCQALDQDAYFETAVAAVKVVNASLIGETVVGSAGKSFARDAFFQALKEQYGDIVARSVSLSCGPQDYLVEIRVTLGLNFLTGKGMKELVGDAPGGSGATSRCGVQIRVEANGIGR